MKKQKSDKIIDICVITIICTIYYEDKIQILFIK
jgi:hypothetical protein